MKSDFGMFNDRLSFLQIRLTRAIRPNKGSDLSMEYKAFGPKLIIIVGWVGLYDSKNFTEEHWNIDSGMHGSHRTWDYML